MYVTNRNRGNFGPRPIDLVVLQARTSTVYAMSMLRWGRSIFLEYGLIGNLPRAFLCTSPPLSIKRLKLLIYRSYALPSHENLWGRFSERAAIRKFFRLFRLLLDYFEYHTVVAAQKLSLQTVFAETYFFSQFDLLNCHSIANVVDLVLISLKA